MIWRASLFAKYALPLVVLVSGALVVSGLVGIYFSYEENKTALARVQREKAIAAALRIEQFVRELEHDLTWIAQTPWGSHGVTLDQRRLDSLRLLRQVPAITEVSHIDPTGHEQLRVSRLAMDVLGSNADFSGDPKFQEPMARKTYFSPVYFRKESEPYMTIALSGIGEDAGVVAAEANLKFIWDVVSNLRVGTGGYAYVVDSQGHLIAHPDISLVLKKTDLSTLPQVQAAGAPTRSAANDAIEVIIGKDRSGEEVLSAYAIIAPLNWTVLVDLPLAEAFAPIYTSIWHTVVLLVVGIAISVIASLILVRRMVAPIHALRDGAARIGAGALNHRISVKTGDELESLADEFNRTTAKLQESYATLERKVEERTRDLTEALEQQTATAEILKVISQSQTDAQPVFNTIAERARALCDAAHVGVTTFDGKLIHVAALANLSPEGATALLGSFPRPPGRDTATGNAILDRKVFAIPDVSDYPGYGLTLAANAVTFRSALAVPMLRDGNPIGAITIMRSPAGPFSAREIELLQTFADQAVIAIENVRLFKELEERNKALTEALEQQTATAEILRVISSSPTDLTPVLDTVAKYAARLCDAGDAGVFQVEGERLRSVARYGPLPNLPGQELAISRDTASGRAVIDRCVVQIPDLLAESDAEFAAAKTLGASLGFRTVLAAPMLREGTAIGAIIIRRAEARPFSDNQIELLKTFADQAVIAIENVRLFKELEERNKALTEALEQQTATAEVLQVIASSPSSEQPVFEAILRSGVALCEPKLAAIFRFDGTLVHLVASHDWSLEARNWGDQNYPTAPTQRLIGPRTILKKAITEIDDTFTDPDYDQSAAKTGGWRRMLGVPLLREGQVLGSIALAWTSPGKTPRRQIELIKTFADQAVIAIENVRLFKELESRTQELAHSVQQLQALSDVSQAVNSTLDLQQVLSAIVTRAVQLSSTHSGAVYEHDEVTGELHLRATYGMEPDVVEAMLAKSLRVGEGATGRAAETREPFEVTDLRSTTFYAGALREVVERAGVRSILAVPLLREGRVVGALSVGRTISGSFPPEVINVLQTFAAQSTVAIQNARLFREIEQKSRELEVASQHKSQFLANMSHELRTPLNAILGYTELVVDRIYGEVPEKILDVLERVQKSGRHLLGLINDVLDLSKIEAGQLTLSVSDYSFQDVVQSVVSSVESLASEKGLKLKVDIAKSLPVGRADERRIVQVLMNLVGNAIKFTETGEVAIRVRAADNAFSVSVSDTGPGIPVDQHQKIFEEFQQVDNSSTRNKGGTGLGLAIAKKIIELQGGRIWVESTVGKGSIFSFSLPVRAQRQETVQ